jgi:hypothetical protein
MSDAEMRAALNKAEGGLDELRRLAAEAAHAIGSKAPIVDNTSAGVMDGLRKRFTAECRATFRPDSYLAGAIPTENAAAQDYFACKAAAAKSVSACDSLTAAAVPAARDQATPRKADENDASPRKACQESARQLMLIAAMRGKGDATVCREVGPLFSGLDDARRIMLCEGLVKADCAKAASVYGAVRPAEEQAKCKMLVSLKTATSAAACDGVKGINFDHACRESFRNAAGCRADETKLADAHCGPVVENRIKLLGPELEAEAKKRKVESPGAVAMENFKKKRGEIEAILTRVDLVSRSAPAGGDRQSVAKLKKLRSAVAEIVKDLKTATSAPADGGR